MPLPGLILFSHGSLLCGADRLLIKHVARLKSSGEYCAVEPGYLNYSRPSLEEATERCVAAGADKIVIVPYFLVEGYFVSTELPIRLKKVMPLFPNIEFCVSRSIEDAPMMVRAVEQALETATDIKAWQEKTIAQAKSDCEMRPDCPLFKSLMCRASDQ